MDGEAIGIISSGSDMSLEEVGCGDRVTSEEGSCGASVGVGEERPERLLWSRPTSNPRSSSKLVVHRWVEAMRKEPTTMRRAVAAVEL